MRSGGALYRGWAEQETDPEAKAALLAAAEREDENAVVLEQLATKRSARPGAQERRVMASRSTT